MTRRFYLLLRTTLLALLSTLQGINAGAIADFKEVFSEVSQMTEDSIDVLVALDKVKDKLPQLLRLAGPAGTLVAEFAQLGFDSETDEMHAIGELKQLVTTGFETLNHRIWDIHHANEYAEEMLEYGLHVTDKLASLEEKFGLITTEATKHSALADFIHMCGISHSPSGILRRIQRHTVGQCPTPTAQQSVIYNKLASLFSRYEWWKSEFATQFGRSAAGQQQQKFPLSIDILRRIQYRNTKLAAIDYFMTHSNVEDVDAKIQEMEKMLEHNATSFGTFDEDYESFFYKLLPASVARYILGKGTLLGEEDGDASLFSCFLNAVALKHDNKRAPLFHVAQIITADIVKISLIGPFCASVGRDPFYAQAQIDVLLQLSTKILAKLAKWITAKLELAWPHLITSAGVAKIGSAQVSAEQFQRLAQQIAQATRERGMPFVGYNVLLGDAALGWQKSCVIAENCTDIIGTQNNVKFVIARFWPLRPQFERLADASIGTCETKQQTILDKLAKHSESEDVGAAIGLDKLFASHIFNAAVLVKNSAFFGRNCRVDVKVAQSVVAGPATTTHCRISAIVSELLGNYECFVALFAI